MGLSLRLLASGSMDRGAKADIGGAAAKVAIHRRIDIGVRGSGVLLKQRGGRHDLTWLAVAALGDIEGGPGRLHLSAHGIGADALDRRDGLAAHRRNRRGAGPPWGAIDM